jgi:hypothetical protein
MKDTMDEIEHATEDEEVPEGDLDDAEPSPEDIAEAAETALPPDPATEGDVESIQELVAKQEAATEDETEDEDEVVVPLTADDKVGDAVDNRIVPMQETEFMCKRCFLVKHRSQLADRKKMLCRDCA